MSTATVSSVRPSIAQSHAPRRRLLLVAYNFPPVGGAGVQRPVKWVKYLQRAGWETTVLTPSNPSVPVLDESLLAEVPQQARILRAPTWEPSYAVKRSVGSGQESSHGLLSRGRRWVKGLCRSAANLVLQPDPQVLWAPNAIATATKTLRQSRHDAILCTAPPYSGFLIGCALQRKFGLPLILDYRDEWDLSSAYLENASRDWYSQFVQTRMQRWILRHADAVIATTQASARQLANRLQSIRHNALTTCIYNGYDAEDFAHVEWPIDVPPPADGRYRLVYTGTLWNLTTIAPLVQAIEHLHATHPELSARLELVCVGRKTSEQAALIERLRQTSAAVVNVDYCDHARVLDWLRSAHGVCLLLSDLPGAERVVPAKLFEYLAIRKPMLSILPDGEAADLASRFQPTGRFHPQNITGIAEWLTTQLTTTPANARLDDAADVAEFSRESQTDRLIDVLDELTGSTIPLSAGGRS